MSCSERKTGLDAVLDEVEDIVRRNTQELSSELESLFDAARMELTEELSEIVRMAYERRRQLHLAALAAGRVQSSVTGNTGDSNGLHSTTRFAAGPAQGPSSSYSGDDGDDADDNPASRQGSGRGGRLRFESISEGPHEAMDANLRSAGFRSTSVRPVGGIDQGTARSLVESTRKVTGGDAVSSFSSARATTGTTDPFAPFGASEPGGRLE